MGTDNQISSDPTWQIFQVSRQKNKNVGNRLPLFRFTFKSDRHMPGSKSLTASQKKVHQHLQPYINDEYQTIAHLHWALLESSAFVNQNMQMLPFWLIFIFV